MIRKTLIITGISFMSVVSGQDISAKNNSVYDLPDYEILKTKIDLSDGTISVDHLSEYPGGLIAVRKTIADHLDTSTIRKSKEPLQSRVYFIIEKDGTISNITSIGASEDFNKEAEKAAGALKKKWNPAKIEEQPVRYIYSFPLYMTFQ